MRGLIFGRGHALRDSEKPAPSFPDEPASGVRLTSMEDARASAGLAWRFAVYFEDGHSEPFACVLDAHDRMNTARGAVRTVRVSDGATTAVPVPFGYVHLWNGREPEGF